MGLKLVEISLTRIIDYEPECEISNIAKCQKVKWFEGNLWPPRFHMFSTASDNESQIMSHCNDSLNL